VLRTGVSDSCRIAENPGSQHGRADVVLTYKAPGPQAEFVVRTVHPGPRASPLFPRLVSDSSVNRCNLVTNDHFSSNWTSVVRGVKGDQLVVGRSRVVAGFADVACHKRQRAERPGVISGRPQSQDNSDPPRREGCEWRPPPAFQRARSSVVRRGSFEPRSHWLWPDFPAQRKRGSANRDRSPLWFHSCRSCMIHRYERSGSNHLEQLVSARQMVHPWVPPKMPKLEVAQTMALSLENKAFCLSSIVSKRGGLGG
jgi:hypothetical protein